MALQQRRALSGSRSFDRFSCRLVDSQDIISIHFHARQAIPLGAAGNRWTFRGFDESHFSGIHIIFTYKNHRELPGGRHVNPFVERAVVAGAVPKESDPDPVILRQTGSIARPAGQEIPQERSDED